MLRVNKLTDYAVEILCRMANYPEKTYNAVELADSTVISKPTVSKILKLLVSGNLIFSTRGVAGGYRLKFPANEISVGQVIETMEGQVAMTECSLESGACLHVQQCRTKHNWQKINRAIFELLNGITIEDMKQPIEKINSN